jgi:hypothetical protein
VQPFALGGDGAQRRLVRRERLIEKGGETSGNSNADRARTAGPRT